MVILFAAAPLPVPALSACLYAQVTVLKKVNGCSGKYTAGDFMN